MLEGSVIGDQRLALTYSLICIPRIFKFLGFSVKETLEEQSGHKGGRYEKKERGCNWEERDGADISGSPQAGNSSRG